MVEKFDDLLNHETWSKFTLMNQMIHKGVIMADPLGELEEALAYMFELQKTPWRGKYINPLVEDLKRAIDKYREGNSNLSILTKAITRAFPVIENYVDGYTVKQKWEALSGNKGESVNWYTQNRPENSQSQAEEMNSNVQADFFSWLSLQTGQNFTRLDAEKQVRLLVNEQSQKELRIKLGVHLHRNPDFLLNLALVSLKNFISLMSSRFCFKFEKHQVAKAIYHHGKAMVDESSNSPEQLEELINFFDKKLAPNGFSIENLLKDPLAKLELEKLPLYADLESEKLELSESNPLKPNAR